MDSLTYHLSRAAAWAQHGGSTGSRTRRRSELTRTSRSPSSRSCSSSSRPGAACSTRVPQYLAELAVLVAVYGSARRLGFEVRASACAAFLFATFSVVALESFTAQNDLFGASLVAVATLPAVTRRPARAGARRRRASGFGLGHEAHDRPHASRSSSCSRSCSGGASLAWGLAGGVVGFLAIGMWGYVMNHHVHRPLARRRHVGRAEPRLARVPGEPPQRVPPDVRADGRVDPVEPADSHPGARRDRNRDRHRRVGALAIRGRARAPRRDDERAAVPRARCS